MAAGSATTEFAWPRVVPRVLSAAWRQTTILDACVAKRKAETDAVAALKEDRYGETKAALDGGLWLTYLQQKREGDTR